VDELISARQHLRPAWRPSIRQRHFNEGLFNGFDFTTMLRIGSMNMALHGARTVRMPPIATARDATLPLKHATPHHDAMEEQPN
jgi:hypothetical protein